MFQELLPERQKLAGAVLELGRVGSGPTLVYLHGCDGVSLSDPFIAPLAASFDVIVPSLPGFGESELPIGLRKVGDLARYLHRALQELELRDITLVGSSFGGWVALEMALAQSRLISRLVLAAPLGLRFTRRPDQVEIRDIFTIPAEDLPGFLISNPARAEAAFSGMRFPQMPEGSALRYCRNRETLTRFGWSPLLHDPGLARRLGNLDVPTMLLAGSEDAILTPAYTDKLAAGIPHAHLHMIEGAGHYIAIEKPVEFARAIAVFARADASKGER